MNVEDYVLCSMLNKLNAGCQLWWRPTCLGNLNLNIPSCQNDVFIAPRT